MACKQSLPMSARFLISSHDYVGQLSLCTEDGGRLLMILVEEMSQWVRRASGDGNDSGVADGPKKAVEQALYCLFCHPSKKSRAKHLVDHGSATLALTWERCPALAEVVKPSKIPEYDDFKSLSITADTEALLRRFVALVPDSFALKERADTLETSFKRLCNNKEGRRGELPSFENTDKFPKELKDIFYLLADYYFKNSNFASAVPMYIYDLTFNPKRLDSFVALSLSRASLVEEKICRNRKDERDVIREESVRVISCYREAIRMEESGGRRDGTKAGATVFIEAANFAYIMCSFWSRVMKADASFFSIEEFENCDKQQKLFADFASTCYAKAADYLKRERERKAAIEDEEVEDDNVDETWLVLFMRGKLKEKDGKSFPVVAEEYLAAMSNLVDQGAIIPRKVSFGPGTPDLALELLEIYYRFHASLIKEEFRPDFKAEVEEKQEYVDRLAALVDRVEAMKVFSFKIGAGKGPSASQEEGDDDEPVAKRGKASRSWDDVAEKCVEALERTKDIFPHHYKALHRLAHYFLKSKKQRDLKRAKRYLLGAPEGVVGKEPSLFGDKKAYNMFYGIWRHPVNEFERSGSFPAHVAKCVSILFEVYNETRDHNGFLDATLFLRKAPDGDRKYLYEDDRQACHEEATVGLMRALQQRASRCLTALPEGHGEEERNARVFDRARLMADVAFALNKLKKFFPRCDSLKDMIKRLYCTVANRKSCSFDEANSLANKLHQADKGGALKAGGYAKVKEVIDEHMRPKLLAEEEKSRALAARTQIQAATSAQNLAIEQMAQTLALERAAAEMLAAGAASCDPNYTNMLNNIMMAAAAAAAAASGAAGGSPSSSTSRYSPAGKSTSSSATVSKTSTAAKALSISTIAASKASRDASNVNSTTVTSAASSSMTIAPKPTSASKTIALKPANPELSSNDVRPTVTSAAKHKSCGVDSGPKLKKSLQNRVSSISPKSLQSTSMGMPARSPLQERAEGIIKKC